MKHDIWDPLDRSRMPVDEWRLVESRYDHDHLARNETLFALGNGYLGMRGTPEEGRDAVEHGTYINGFHETWPIRHAEEAHGFARTGQTMVNVPDSTVMKIYVDDEPLLLSVADLPTYERALDFRAGVLTRDFVWRTPAGKRCRIRSTRMVSFTERHLVLYTLEITMLDGDAPIVVSSQIINRQDGSDEYRQHLANAAQIDPRKAVTGLERVLESIGHWNSDRRMILGYRCLNSGMTLAVGADHTIATDNTYEQLIDTQPDHGRRIYRIKATQGAPITITKAVAYHSSRGIPVRELFDRVRRTLDRVREEGFEPFEQAQRDYLAEFWERSDVEIEAHPVKQQAIRWCLFQLAQAAARADQMGIPAKGLTGTGYEGHYFWDTDIYVVPFLIFTNPRWARNALRFRVNLLPAARRRARELSQRGALFPWRTINGEEASAHYAAGTAQYHIDADIAYALSKYADITGDTEFMYSEGATVLAETARLWADLGFWRHNGGSRFHIHGVTGPDEYTTVVSNNLFTNVMARANLRRASAQLREMRERDRAAYDMVAADIDLDERELAEWDACADGMVIPYDETVGINPQDDAFLSREVWDLPATPPSKRPLLLHFHPLVIYRFQVLKQADVVLALFLQNDEFTREQKEADFRYYDPITTGDSSLSAVVQSIIAAEVGLPDLALDYFRRGLFVDLADMQGNTADGVHIASAGGVWASLVCGFGGMRDTDGRLRFDPRLPASWPSLRFPLTVRGSRIRVTLRRHSIAFTLEEGEPIEVEVRGEPVYIGPGGAAVDLADQGPVVPDLDGDAVLSDHRADGSVITSSVPNPNDQWEFPESPWDYTDDIDERDVSN